MGQSELDAAAAVVPPSTIRTIDSEDEAKALAGRLVLPGRRWPVVVVTVPAGQEEPFADPAKIKEDVGDLAEVVVMPTGDISWAFSIAMPQMTQVYGGAGRVYPVDHHWVSKPSRSRLRFAYSPQDRARITEHLINDALEAALTAGLLESRSAPGARVRTGEVLGVIGSRAVVVLDDATLATVWEELTLPGVPLDRLVAKGQTVTGTHDPVSKRLDLRRELRGTTAADAAVAVTEAYRVGDVVLADVAAVTDESVTVRLLPGLPVAGAVVKAALGEHFRLGQTALVPSYDLTGPSFDPARYWRGPGWFSTTWLLWRALTLQGEWALDRVAVGEVGRLLVAVRADRLGFVAFTRSERGVAFSRDESGFTLRLTAGNPY